MSSISTCHSAPKCSLPLADRPRLELRIPGQEIQLDFSALPGNLGWEWAQALQHRQVRVPPISILRVYCGPYGSEELDDHKVVLGGLEFCLQKLDASLARQFPVTIHVAYKTERNAKEKVIQEPGWKGKIVLHPHYFLGDCLRLDTRKILQLAKYIDADFLHIHYASAPFACFVAKEAKKISTAITFHSFVPQRMDPRKRIYKRDFRRTIEMLKAHFLQEGLFAGAVGFLDDLAQRAAMRFIAPQIGKGSLYDLISKRGRTPYYSVGLVAVSEHSRLDFQGRASCVIGDPMDVDRFNPAKVTTEQRQKVRKELGVSDQDMMVVYPARLCKLKGQNLLVPIAVEVAKRLDNPVKFILIGPEDRDGFCQTLKEAITRANAEKLFVLGGARSQEFVRDALAASDLFVFPTLHEALGGCAIEAQLMELPVVGHNVGGIPEVVKHEESGILVAPGDTKGFANAIVHLLESPELRSRYGREGRLHNLKQFDADRIANRYMEEVYLPQILSRNPSKYIWFD